MDYLLHICLTVFHAGIVLFILAGWIWKRTRGAHLVLLLLTALSWFGLGLFFGMGYCFLTHWHWNVLERMGQRDLPASFIKYALDEITGGDWDPALVDALTAGGYIFAVGAAAWLRMRDTREGRAKREPGSWIRPAFTGLLCLGVTIGCARALVYRWTADDAFITFRYALNWSRGLGPVFNPGERVEGYTNFLWMALLTPFAERLDLEVVATGMGLLAYGLFLLVVLFRGAALSHPELGQTATAWRDLIGTVPLTLPALALHKHLSIYATSGLETILFTLLITTGFLSLVRASRSGTNRFAPGVLLLTGASLTRPDGLLLLACGIGFAAYRTSTIQPRQERLPSLLRTCSPFLLIYVPYWCARFAYYGLPWPNTFYAKSASNPYFGQGLHYLFLYFSSYWILILLAATALVFAVRRILGSGARPDPSLVTGALAVALWCSYVAYVGGDFMFARFLIPITPLLLLTGEGLLRFAWPDLKQSRFALLFALVTSIFTLARYDPFAGRPLPVVRDVSEEHLVYTRANRERLRRAALALKPAVQAANPVLAFYGSQAALIYYWDVDRAIEAETGLTDAGIAARPLDRRGRIGHEKEATRRELLDRNTDWALRPAPEARPDFVRLRARGLGEFEILCYRRRVMDRLPRDSGFRYRPIEDVLDSHPGKSIPALYPGCRTED